MARSLLPREHGAYVQLCAPLVAGFALTGAEIAAVLFAVGALAAFVVNEPLLILLGHRGRRARDRDGRQARVMLVVLATIALSSGVAGFAITDDAARSMAIAALAPAAIVVWLAWRKRERTLGGELVTAVVLTGAGAPVSVAAGITWSTAAALWAAWAVGYACTVIAIHRVLARHRRPASRVDHLTAVALVGVVIGAVVLRGPALVALPLAASSLVLVVWPPRATKLRAIGFALVGASILSIVLALLGAA